MRQNRSNDCTLSWTISLLSSEAIFNTDLNTIENWADARLVSFHAGKAYSTIISRTTEPAVHPSLTMNNTVISETQTHKHLGLTLSSLTILVIYAGKHGQGLT